MRIDLRSLEVLDEEIATLSAQMNVATHQLLQKIRTFDEKNGWAPQGFVSCAQYLSYRIGLAPGVAREKVRVAHALKALSKIDASLASGALSFSKVRALTRIATPENEEELLAIAHDVSAAALEEIVRAYRRVETQESAEKRETARAVTTFVDVDGMVVVQARLLPEEGALLRKILQMAEPGTSSADAFVQALDRALRNSNGNVSDRHQVVLHVDAQVLAKCDESGRCEIDGNGVFAETAQRLCCDASLVVMTHDKDGNVVETGRKSRTVSTPLRRKIEERDGHCCVFPGCTNCFTEIHHVTPWSMGGPTTEANCASLCATHHRYVHELGFEMDHSFKFYDRNGRVLSPTPPKLPAAGALPTPSSLPAMARFTGRDIDYGYVVSALRRD